MDFSTPGATNIFSPLAVHLCKRKVYKLVGLMGAKRQPSHHTGSGHFLGQMRIHKDCQRLLNLGYLDGWRERQQMGLNAGQRQFTGEDVSSDGGLSRLLHRARFSLCQFWEDSQGWLI